MDQFDGHRCDICQEIVSILRCPSSQFRTVELGSGTDLMRVGPCRQHQELLASAFSQDGTESADEIADIAGDITRVMLIKTPVHSSTVIKMVTATVSQRPRPGVFGIYMVKKPDDPDYFIEGRILHPQWIENHLPGLWKSTCNHEHGNACRNFLGKSLSNTRPTWLVDVEDGCLVPAPETCSYVALSYVWGNIQTLHATQSNVLQLQEKGALYNELETPIAATILDAMGVVSLLDEKYLWVDTLCIVQDDSTQKHTEMAKMSGIYANASVTILAVQGEHANSGLRGFQGISLPRNLCQSVHRLQGGEIVTMHPLSHVSHEVGVNSPTWESRGWTYQENIFSERRLIFDGDSIRWECPSSVMSEHVETSRHIEPTHFGIRATQALFKPSIPDLYGLQLILRDYNTRAFTYPEDALNAFAGMAYSFSLAFVGCFVSGLPSAFFGLALLWQPSERLFRRVARGQSLRQCLPSWSWAGWSGRIKFDYTSAADFIRNGNLTGASLQKHRCHVTPILKWKYHETKDSPGIAIDANILQVRQDWIDGLARISEGWTEHAISGSPKAKYEPPSPRRTPKTYFKHEAHPAHQFWYPIPLQEQRQAVPGVLAPYVSCQTRRATLYLERSQKEGRHGRILSLQDKDRTKVGILQIHENLEATETDSRIVIELVEVGFVLSQQPFSQRFVEDSKPPLEESRITQWFKSYKVMWVEWNDGIAYRKGLGEVTRSNWEEYRGEQFALMLG